MIITPIARTYDRKPKQQWEVRKRGKPHGDKTGKGKEGRVSHPYSSKLDVVI